MSRKRKITRPDTPISLIIPVVQENLELSLGNQLRKLRHEQGLSLRSLAEKSGLSANTLSLIENGKTSPSVGTLHQIAVVFNLPIIAFFEKEQEKPVVFTRHDDRKKVEFPHGTTEDLGTVSGSEDLQLRRVSLNPHTSGGPQPLHHEGSEFVFCLSGRVIYNVTGKEYILDTGDSILFPSTLPHTWSNPLDENSEVVIVMAGSV